MARAPPKRMPPRRLLTAGRPRPLSICVSVSREGLPTRIVALMDQVGQLAGLVLAPGNAHEPHSRPALPDGVPANELIAAQAYDTNAALALLAERNIAAVTPSRANRRRRAGLTLARMECVIWQRTDLRR